MAGDTCSSSIATIFIDGVTTSFSNKITAIRFEMAKKIATFHYLALGLNEEFFLEESK